MTTRDQLKYWFRKGAFPTAEQFAEWIDSFFHKTDRIPADQVNGLSATLNTFGQQINGVASSMNAINTQLTTRMAQLSDRLEDLEDTQGDFSYTLDYGDKGVLLQDINMNDASIEVYEVVAVNVSRLLVSYGDVIRAEVPLDSSGVNVTIPSKSVAIWEIERTVDDDLAAVGIRYRKDTL